MRRYQIEYQSKFLGGWMPLFQLSDGTGKQHDSYTDALRAFSNHLNAMLDSDEGDDVSLENYRIKEIENA